MEATLSIFKALSDRNRLRIVGVLLTHSELCACQITELLQLAGATVSRHLGIMVQAGVLKNRRQGRWIYFRLNPDNKNLEPLLAWIRQQFGRSDQWSQDLDTVDQILRIPCEDLCRKQKRGTDCSDT
ncbi:MAG: ArsR family transcriptional regulator [Desulfobacteraceae bacterium]|nr:MAG: ArsR family transcriptional regulator [Desulfobacteraceae bacterium]